MRGALVIVALAACRGSADEPSASPAPPAPPPAPPAQIAPPDAPPACRPNALPCEETFTDPNHQNDYLTRFEYTPSGKIAVERDVDVSTDRLFKTVRTTYDPHDRRILVETRDGNDKLTFVEHYEYKGADRDPTRVRLDTDGDGTIDEVEHHRYRRDGDQYIDDEQDSRFHTLYVKRFDAAGHMISHGQLPFGTKPGPGDKPDEFEYDAHGHVTRQTQWTHDGTPDYWTQTNTYDACGNLVRVDEDWHDDGTIDESEIYDYCAEDH